MKKVLINGLLVDNKSAGIGNYGYNFINNLNQLNTDYDITVLWQKNEELGDINTIKKSYSNSYKRILDEQFFLLSQYKENDLIHFIDYGSPVMNIRKPIIITIHDLSYFKFPETFTFGSRKIKETISPISAKRASKIIVDSKSTKKDVLNQFKVDESKVKIIYPGKPNYSRVNDNNKIQMVKNKYNIYGDYILYLGTLEPRKNILRLIQAYYKLFKNGISEKLVIAGKKGWLYEEIFYKVKELKLQEKIIFTDYVDEVDKPALYSGAKVFIYPSLYEGFGLPPLEAMSCGTPVVASDTSSLPEVVGKSGLYINPKNIDSIAKGIYDIIIDEELRIDLKNRGKERSKMFNWSNTTNEILSIYDEILR